MLILPPDDGIPTPVVARGYDLHNFGSTYELLEISAISDTVTSSFMALSSF
jgi:hypothetical protein